LGPERTIKRNDAAGMAYLLSDRLTELVYMHA
jgi:hypothetical protein